MVHLGVEVGISMLIAGGKDEVCLLSVLFSAVLALSACDTLRSGDHAVPKYTKPGWPGLSPVRPYPNPDDVCWLLDESRNGRALIACPRHEKGAMEDRRNEGARFVENVSDWVVLSITAAGVR